MKNKEVIFTEKNIHYKDNNRNVVMDRASKKLMEFYSFVVTQNKGDVLDIGFGMGFSANAMSSHSDSYTCIEINPQIYKRASEWAKDRPNVNIIFGDWSEIIPTLGLKYDGIFMDTYDDHMQPQFENYAKSIAKEGCILSIFNYFTQRDRDTMNEYEYKLDIGKFTTTVKDSHIINWTVFNRGEFIKTSNIINFPKPDKMI